MVRVSTDIALTLPSQTGRTTPARGDMFTDFKGFGSLVDRSSADLTPPVRADVPAPQRDDRPVAERPKSNTKANDAADRAAPSPRDDGSAASRTQDRRKTAASDDVRKGADDKSAKSGQSADSKTESANGEDARLNKDTTDAAAGDTAETDGAGQPAALAVVPVAVPTGTPLDGAAATPATPETAGSSQPLAIAAAAALKVKLETAAAAGTDGPAVPTGEVPADAEATFAALIAGATPAGAKGSKTAAGREKATTADGAGELKADAKAKGASDAVTAAPTDGTTAQHKPATEGKPEQGAAEAAKPDAGAVTTDQAKPAKETHAQRGEHAQQAAPDLTPTTMPQPQPAHLQANTNIAAATPQATLQMAANPPVPLAGVAVEIAQSAKAGKTSFDIRLDPAELGRIDVRIEMDKHGNVTSHLTVEKPETLTMLRQDAPQLQRALEQAGFKANDSGLQFSLRDQSPQQQQQNNGDQSGRQPHRLTIHDDDTVTVAPAARGYGRMYGANTGVDISI